MSTEIVDSRCYSFLQNAIEKEKAGCVLRSLDVKRVVADVSIENLIKIIVLKLLKVTLNSLGVESKSIADVESLVV